jgi:2'-5' RNA ligase
MEKKDIKKVFHTALVIVPDQQDQIQAIREKYDTAYDRWPPHINVEFPFVAPEQFDEVFEVLQHELKDFKAFPIKFGRISHLKNSVMVLEPETQDNEILKLFNKIFTVRYS